MRSAILLAVIIAAILFISFLPHFIGEQRKFDLTWKINTNPALNFGVPPFKSDEQTQKAFGPIISFLSHHLNRPVHLNIAVDYSSLVNLLDLEIVDFAWFSSALLEDEAKKHEWEVLLRPVQNGKMKHRGLIFSRKGQGINSLTDLKGKRFAYVDRNSGSGFLYPVRLFQKMGIDPLNFFSEIAFTGNHTVSINKVIDGSFDGAAVFEGSFPGIAKSASVASGEIQSATGSLFPGSVSDGMVGSQPTGAPHPALGSEESQIEPLAYTDWILNDAFVVKRNLDPECKNKILKVMIDMEKSEKGPETLSQLKVLMDIDRFISEKEIRKEVNP